MECPGLTRNIYIEVFGLLVAAKNMEKTTNKLVAVANRFNEKNCCLIIVYFSTVSIFKLCEPI